MNIIQEIKDSFKSGTSLTRLIYINIGVFLGIHIVSVFFYLFSSVDPMNQIVELFAVPADPATLLRRPWTLVSYMFLHKDFFHILFNIAWLYWFGKIFLEYLDEKRLLNAYLLGGISGAVLYIISYNIFPVLNQQAVNSVALGASAAVMAIVIAAATYAPNHEIHIVFIGPVKIIWVALVGFILSSLVDFSMNTGGKIAHIGGALFGYLFILRYKQGKDITTWFTRIMDTIFTLFKPRKKMHVSHKKPTNDYEYNLVKKEKQKNIDAILDKISKSGYDSLTKEEKETLFKMGK
ncbi:MAG: rhomboid family intramembrane serine protease [Bacteroidales bacterium]|nr:rhomboid family intramembrane serine protease [Bacteroidales bacterium]MCB8998600.1 rhomboid family intramembrane serine protease [Bacteroidales bacterium]MCB9012532.1 rhomboid family intramembrane serine protease [Bacteroidales bacterium]